MAEYKYKSIDQRGKIIQGTLHATNILEIEHRLQKVKQDLISAKEIKPRLLGFGRNKLERRDLINFVFQLQQLTKAGVPLLDGISDLRDSTESGYFKDVLSSLSESIGGGKTFSESLKQFPKDFDDVFVALIEVGEESGELPEILRDLGESLKWVDELVAKAYKILMYPAIVLTVVLSVTLFMMLYLVPKIIPFVNEMGGEIPGYTQALISLSDFLSVYWWLIIAIPIGATVFIRFMTRRSPRFAYQMDSLRLKMPIFGPLSFKLKIARFVSYVALLYSSGITVLRSLEIGKSLVGNKVLIGAIEEVKTSIEDGENITESFAKTGIFPPFVIRMIRIGENTGELDEALKNVEYFYTREVQEQIDKIEPTILPILVVIMASILGWVMIAMLGPIWDMFSKLG